MFSSKTFSMKSFFPKTYSNPECQSYPQEIAFEITTRMFFLIFLDTGNNHVTVRLSVSSTLECEHVAVTRTQNSTLWSLVSHTHTLNCLSSLLPTTWKRQLAPRMNPCTRTGVLNVRLRICQLRTFHAELRLVQRSASNSPQ